jgi:hypothetical protein
MKTRVEFFKVCFFISIFLGFHASATLFYVDVNSTNPTPPYADWITAATNIQSAVDAASNGDQVLVNDGIYNLGGTLAASGTATTNRVAVNKAITVQSLNGPAVTTIQGRQIPGTINGASAIRCVYLTNGASLIGFTLTKGATVVSTSDHGGGVWCQSASAVVSNCFFTGNSALAGCGAYAGTINNCIFSNNATFSTGGGGGALSSILNNCLIISNSVGGAGGGVIGGILNNCTLIGNSAQTGGGANGATLTNCVLTGNLATQGGGASSCMLNNCILTGNLALQSGGGASGGILNNCLVTSNIVTTTAVGQGGGTYNAPLTNCTICWNFATNSGGGVYLGNIYNCIVYYNLAPNGSNYSSGSFFSYCCSVPKPVGTSNFTNAPLFINMAGGNFRLQTNSPCINSGYQGYNSGDTDADGRPRIIGGTVDMGAYEFQAPGTGEFIGWLQQYGLPKSGSADFIDSDGDGMNNWQERIAGTNPTNAASVLQMLTPSNSVSGLTVTWQSVSGVTYYLQSATNLLAQPVFSTIQSNIIGNAGTSSYTDTTATNGGPLFYRVGVQ